MGISDFLPLRPPANPGSQIEARFLPGNAKQPAVQPHFPLTPTKSRHFCFRMHLPSSILSIYLAPLSMLAINLISSP